jgi:hypothetical protein
LPAITWPLSSVSVNISVETYPTLINDIEYEADNEEDWTHLDLTFPTLPETFEALLLDSTLGKLPCFSDSFFKALLLDSTLGAMAVLGRWRKIAKDVSRRGGSVAATEEASVAMATKTRPAACFILSSS